MTSVDSNFNFLCGRPHGAEPLPPSTCVHLSLTPSPLCVDAINGWPLWIKGSYFLLGELRAVHVVCWTCQVGSPNAGGTLRHALTYGWSNLVLVDLFGTR